MSEVSNATSTASTTAKGGRKRAPKNKSAQTASGATFTNHSALMETLPHPIIVVGDDNKIIFANSAAEIFLRTSSAVLQRHRLEEILAFGCPLISLVEQVRRQGSSFNEYGIEVESPRLQSPQLTDVFGGPMADNEDMVVLMFQRREMAQMIERQLTHRAAARSVSGMAAVLAHEIKNPLSGIRGAAQLLEPNIPDEDRALTQLICAETDRIRDLVDRMEVFGDERPLSKEKINIHDVLDHVCQIAQSGFAQSIIIVKEFDPSLPAVPGNRDKLVQAFLNLVKNASEAFTKNQDNRRIVIQTAFRPGMRLSVPGTSNRTNLPLMIQIHDNGSGVPEHLRPHMFDPFVTTKANGTGLGLALVAKIIADHGGVIECDSDASTTSQTTFRVLLPMHSIQPPEQETS